jgi:hypothetical protein
MLGEHFDGYWLNTNERGLATLVVEWVAYHPPNYCVLHRQGEPSKPPFLSCVWAIDPYVRCSRTREAVEKTEKTHHGGARKKDPKAPKRALSAYMFFS